MGDELDLADEVLFDLSHLIVQYLDDVWLKTVSNVVKLAFNLRSDCISLLWIRHGKMARKDRSGHFLLIVLRNGLNVTLLRIFQLSLDELQFFARLQQFLPQAHVHGREELFIIVELLIRENWAIEQVLLQLHG